MTGITQKTGDGFFDFDLRTIEEVLLDINSVNPTLKNSGQISMTISKVETFVENSETVIANAKNITGDGSDRLLIS